MDFLLLIAGMQVVIRKQTQLANSCSNSSLKEHSAYPFPWQLYDQAQN
jgi:hypothetical protein